MLTLRILIVEDDSMIAMSIEDAIRQMGHAVVGVVSSEDEAVDAAARLAPDLMVVDNRLRIGTGMDAMRRILAHGPLPHIYISGDGLIGDELEPGAVLLMKPFSDEDLAAAIATAASGAPRR